MRASLARSSRVTASPGRLTTVRQQTTSLRLSCNVPAPLSRALHGSANLYRSSGYSDPLRLRRSFHVSAILREDKVVQVPQMAESISEGTLKQWLKKKGDYVEADEEVATIETDKIDVSVNAPEAGTITETYAEEEDTVEVGKDLFKMELGGEPSSSGGDKASSESSEKSEEKPKESEDKKESGQEVRERDSGEDKPSAEAEKPESSDSKEQGSDTHSGRKQEDVSSKYENKESSKPAPEPKKSEEPRQPQAAAKKDKPAPPPEKPSEPKKTQSGSGNRTEQRVKMNRMRQRIAERLKQSQNSAASLTTFNEIDMSSLMEFRKLYKDQVLKDHGVKLGFMSAFAKACCLALKEIPAANASIEGPGAGEQIVYRDYVDLSVAVSTPKGLVTPVVRNAEELNFIGIESAIAELGKKARDNKLTIEDMAGGTFTISNGGVFGSLYGTPIINLPQAAVLGMHAIKEKPVVVNGQIVVRPIMVVALTYDHRLLDGREAVTFLVRVKQFIEDPRLMLLT
ncbi:hypothetical protein E5Q_06003 [Mixia osmundae IAM 14324]|uniref:dihydrolipoyllysine-residue succinyltransferase n=1 Tax=Mixia osmundae (strain CBS 9802 / IAM 14324 / JCM 22182 / KY 12970) TaxID=764103 RepID=G7E9I9_MIXOS|nr:hypothetical protein E5Q_06003 [Mixia osmundae IAM 14324]